MSCLIRERCEPRPVYNHLKLRGIFGNRVFSMSMERETGVTTADLAREVECHVGIPPHKQKLLFRGLVLDPPDCGPWAPRLETLQLRDGDRVHVIMPLESVVPDLEDVRRMRDVRRRVECNDKVLAMLVAKTDAFFKGQLYRQPCKKTMTALREEYEHMKSRYRADIEVMSTLTFDYRNVADKSRRRETSDHAQRQIDKCTELAEAIFQRIAVSNCPPNSVRLPPISQIEY